MTVSGAVPRATVRTTAFRAQRKFGNFSESLGYAVPMGFLHALTPTMSAFAERLESRAVAVTRNRPR